MMDESTGSGSCEDREKKHVNNFRICQQFMEILLDDYVTAALASLFNCGSILMCTFRVFGEETSFGNQQTCPNPYFIHIGISATEARIQ